MVVQLSFTVSGYICIIDGSSEPGLYIFTDIHSDMTLYIYLLRGYDVHETVLYLLPILVHTDVFTFFFFNETPNTFLNLSLCF
jgi:hypothetical protein